MVNDPSSRRIKQFAPPAAHEWLLISCGFSCLLLLARVTITGSLAYTFLPWNLFLAFVPYWITGRMIRNVSLIENRFSFYALLGVWLLFIPNSFYIITDLFHLTHIDSAPKWFDLLLIFSFAWNGLLYGIISLHRVEQIFSLQTRKSWMILLVFSVMWLCALGIYIGRFLRFNSWDILTDPFNLAAGISELVTHPFENSYAWGMTMVYGVFMTLLYFTIKKLSESFSVSR
jgi:uncharacterized membrane protein